MGRVGSGGDEGDERDEKAWGERITNAMPNTSLREATPTASLLRHRSVQVSTSA